MTHLQAYNFHRFFFIAFVFLTLFFVLLWGTFLGNRELIIGLLLFFVLGIPHGALDFSLGRLLYKPTFGKLWWLFFLLSYLICVGAIVYFWFIYPLPSFLFFLLISVIHFGCSDIYSTSSKNQQLGSKIFEIILRGFLPIVTPAYFHPEQFTILLENILNPVETAFVMNLAQLLFYPNSCILIALIFNSLAKQDLDNIYNALEIMSVFLLFFFLPPLWAFFIYFCFLHSLRHILSVLEKINLKPSWGALYWIILQALPSTLATLLALSLFYVTLHQGSLDSRLLSNLFFISLAALTFPHMLLVELVKRKI